MFEALKTRLKSIEEGCVPCMYLDTLGYVTCGVGHLLAISGSAMVLPWVLPSGAPASAGQIGDEYAKVKALEPAHTPAYYMQRTVLRLPQSAIDALLDQDVETIHRGVCALVPVFDQWPEPAQDALLDMAFQSGPHGLVSKFPTLIAYAKQGKWEDCATWCHSKGVPESRNQIRAELFKQAAR